MIRICEEFKTVDVREVVAVGRQLEGDRMVLVLGAFQKDHFVLRVKFGVHVKASQLDPIGFCKNGQIEVRMLVKLTDGRIPKLPFWYRLLLSRNSSHLILQHRPEYPRIRHKQHNQQ